MILNLIVKKFQNYIYTHEFFFLKKKGALEAILFSDMKYRNKFFGYPLTVLCLNEVDNKDPQKRAIYLKGYYKKNLNENPVTTYRLYRRYLDFNLDKVSNMLTEIDERNNDKSVFMVGRLKMIFFFNKISTPFIEFH
jgi:hypothetical protein